jgi:hypothetical protein
MNDINLLAVFVATIAAFLLSGGWYAVLGETMVRLQGKEPDPNDPSQKMQPWKIAVELLRSFVVAFVLANFFARLGISNWTEALTYGLWLWLAFPLILLVGSVIHDNVPWRLAAIHAGDWLLKILLMAVILGMGRM